ncbi:MAG: Gldg family protein [Halofilum sp. (in: g-proteobacteria)]|nr:Gldg family protein [Halofilum sp. (in: g-proteobacteria)]
MSVALRNPEYQLTRSIKTVARKYRSGGDLLATLDEPVKFHGYISSAERLPDQLDKLRESLHTILEDMQSDGGDKLTVEFQEPLAGDGSLAQRLQNEYGFRPMTSSITSDRRFYFYMVLEQGGQTVPVQLPDNLDAKALRKAVQSGFERLGGGFQNTVRTCTGHNAVAWRGCARAVAATARSMRQLRENASVTRTQLEGGHVPTRPTCCWSLGPKSALREAAFRRRPVPHARRQRRRGRLAHGRAGQPPLRGPGQPEEDGAGALAEAVRRGHPVEPGAGSAERHADVADTERRRRRAHADDGLSVLHRRARPGAGERAHARRPAPGHAGVDVARGGRREEGRRASR